MRSRILVAAALAAAALSTGSAADAATCVGTAQTAVVCVTVNYGALPKVDPNGNNYSDCVYVGAPPCRPVSVDYPSVTPGSGQLITYSCGGILYCN